MKKHTIQLTQIVLVALMLFLTFSCKKSNDGGHRRDTSKLLTYFPQTVYSSGALIDSFVYNPDFTVDTMFVTSYEGSNRGFSYYVVFRYDGKGNCIRYTRYENIGNKVFSQYLTDSIVYKGNKLTNYFDYFRFKDTVVYTLDADDRIAMVGSRDTVKSEFGVIVNYDDLTYSGENIVRRELVDYAGGSLGGGSSVTKKRITMTYDDMLNPFAGFAIKNPLAMYILLGVSENFAFAVGTNNMTAVNGYTTAAGDNVRQVMTNTCDSVTRYLTEQKVTGTPFQYTLRFNLIKAK